MKADVQYQFHHMGIPTDQQKSDEIHSEKFGMFTSDNPGKFKVQWHRFNDDSDLHPLLKSLPHIAFKVDNFTAAIEGEDLILGPYEPIDGYFVAVINDNGIPIEIIHTELTDEEVWNRAFNRQGDLYR